MISKWMQRLSADYRKATNHLGGVRCFDPTHHPPLGKCRILGDYFDPGNWVYTTVLILLVPSIVNANWTEEKMGNIVEAMIATGMRPCSGQASRAIAVWLEHASGLLYAIVCWFPQVRTLQDIVFLIGYAERHYPVPHPGPIDLNSMD